MKKHNIVKVVLITLFVFLLLSWIFPAAYYSGQYVDQGRTQMGLFDFFNYPVTSLSYFGYISLFIILVGGFYGILYKIPAYRVFLNKIAKCFKGKEMLFVSLVVVLSAFAVSFCGLQIGLLFFAPLVVSVILLLGYDKIVAAMAIVGSTCAGIAGSTYSYSNLNMLTSTLSIKLGYQIGVRLVILLVGIALVIFNIYMYVKRNGKVKIQKVSSVNDDKKLDVVEEVEVKKETKTTSTSTKTKTGSKSSSKKGGSKSSSKKSTKSSKSRKSDNKAALKDDDVIVVKGSEDDYYVPGEVSTNHSTWPFVVGFILIFVLLILAFITWGENGFKITLFDNVTKAVTEFKLFGFPIFGKLLGTINSFGNWTIADLSLPIVLFALLLALIYKVKFDDVLDGFAEGAKKALCPAFVVVLIYTGLVIVTYHPFQLVLYKAILGWTKGFNIVTTVLIVMLSSIFNSDIAYSIQSVMPYYVTVITNSDKYQFIAVIYQSIYGFTMLFAPTGLILMSVLAFLKITYCQWLKAIWKLLLEFFVVLLIIFIILAMI